MKYVLDRHPRKIWSLNQMKIGEKFVGVPTADYYKNHKRNEFVRVMLDAGYSICHMYLLIFSFPEQNVLLKKYHNSFELVRFYRECNGIPVDDNINQFHNVNWQEIIDWINQEEIMKIQVVNQNINGFKNVRFLPTQKIKNNS